MSKQVSIILYDSNKRILLQHRDDKKGIWNPNSWAFFGGGVEEYESYEEAVIRETKEELDYDLNDFDFLTLYDEEKPFIVYHYSKKIFEEEKKTLKLQEGQNWGWFSLEEANKLSWNEGRKEWDYIKKLLKNKLT